MKIRKCIIFDNEDQSDSMEKLIREAKNRGLTVECEQFNVGSPELTEVLTNGEIDISKVVIEYNKRFGGQTFHLAAFDWQLDDDNINGVELIRKLTHHRILRNTPKIMFSGLLNQILLDIIKKEEKNSVNQLCLLVNNDIKGYFEREKYEMDMVNIFLHDEEKLDLIIEEELKKFPELIFENSFISKKFNGKTFKELSMILDDNDVIRNDFKKEIIQQVVAYLTEKI